MTDAADIKTSDFDTNDVFIVDLGTILYVWVGKGASAEERKQVCAALQTCPCAFQHCIALQAMQRATDYLASSERPVATPVVRVVEGGESDAFLKALGGPPPTRVQHHADPEAKQRYAPGQTQGDVCTQR
jgi:hypothetical protein